jgi:methionyl-tRNA formyltransferase
MAKLIFMGTADFACACLDGLEGAGMTPGLIITRPDGVAGRNRRPSQPPVKKWALSRGIEIWQPRMINNPDCIQRLGEICPDLFLVAAYGSILRSEVLAIPRLGAINVHASLLPDLRGAAPIEWAIMLGRTETGITTMEI